MKNLLFTLLVLAPSFSAFAEHNFAIVMKKKAVIERTYNNSGYNTPSLTEQCERVKGTLLKSVDMFRGSTDVGSAVGICHYPVIVTKEEAAAASGKKDKAIYVAIVSQRYPNGSGTATLADRCESMGGKLIDSKYESSGDAYATYVGGGVCKIKAEQISNYI